MGSLFILLYNTFLSIVIFAPTMYAAPPDDLAEFPVNSLFLIFALSDFISKAPASCSAVFVMNLFPVIVAELPSI